MQDQSTPRWIATIGLSVAIFLAPFLALLFSLEAGLGLMAAALLATTFLLKEAAVNATPKARERIRLVVGLNLALAAACASAVVWLILRD